MKSLLCLCLLLSGVGAAGAQGVNEHMIQGAPPYWNAEPYRPEQSRAVPNRPAPPAYIPRIRRIHPRYRLHRG